LDASDIKRLKELEHENSKLTRLDADRALEKAALKDVIAKKLYGLLSGGRWWITWCPRAVFPFSGPVRPSGLGEPRTIGRWSMGHSAMPQSLKR
jgi:hypothetical protein